MRSKKKIKTKPDIWLSVGNLYIRFCFWAKNQDGKVSIKKTILGETEKASGTWEKGDDGFVITREGEKANVKVAGDEMTMSMPEEQTGGMEVSLVFDKK